MEKSSNAGERLNVVVSKIQSGEVSIRTLEDLLEIFIHLNKNALQGIHDPESVKLKALDCLEFTLKKVKLERWNLFSKLFLQLMMLTTSGMQDQIVVASLSEEMKLAITACLKYLVSCSSKKVIKEMLDFGFRLPLGHAVYLLVKLAENERCRAIQSSAMEAILTFLETAEKYDLCVEAGDRFASFLPGLCTSLVRILAGDQKQGHTVFVTAFRALRACITLVLGDDYLETVSRTLKEQQNEQSSDKTAASVKVEIVCGDESLPIPVVSRTEEWVKDVSRKLHVLMRKTVPLVKHDSWQVALAVVEWARDLLFHCTKSLESSMPMFLLVLLTLSMHPYESVGVKSCEALHEFSIKCIHKLQKSLRDILEGELYSYVTRLPRAVRCSGDEEKTSTLNLLCGYIYCLGSSVNRFLCSSPHKERLIHGLLSLVEFNCSDVYLLEERAVSAGALSSSFESSSSSTSIQWPKKSFKHFSNKSVEQGLIQVCRLLGYFGDTMLLADTLLEKMKLSATVCKQAIFLLNEMILGVRGIDVQDSYHWRYLSKQAEDGQNPMKTISPELSSYILDEYLHPDIWDVVSSTSFSGSSIESLMESFSMLNLSNSPKKQPGSVEDQNSNILQKCLLLEGIAKLAQVVGPSFRMSLMRVICPLLERAGSQCAVVSHTAKLALQSLANSCDYKSVPCLISQNADYLVSVVSIKLRRFAQNPDAPFVLQAALQLCDADIIPLLADAVKEVFQALDTHSNEKAMPFMKALHSVVQAVHKFHCAAADDERAKKSFSHMNGSATESPATNVQDQLNKRVKALQEFFLEYHHNKVIAEDLALSEESIETEPYIEDTNRMEEADNKVPLPCHVQIVKQILERCVHILSSEDPWMRLLVLDIIGLGVLSLSRHENELLPLAHNLWSPFVQRFNDPEFVVVKKAFETLVKMADACGDFIRRRTLTDVWPKLASFLDKQCSLSYGKDNSAYKFTIAFKFQSALLLELGNLATKLQICDREISLLVLACIPYLSSHQPKALQEAALKFLCQMSALDADIVWLLLVDTYSSTPELTPPHECFRPVLLGDATKTEFARNVNRLLEYM